MSNIDAIADSVSLQVKTWIGTRLAAMETSLREFVRGSIDALPKAKDGKDFDPSLLGPAVQKAVDAIPRPKDGADGVSVDPVAIAAQIIEAATKAVQALPKANDGLPGKDADEKAIEERIVSKVMAAFDQIPVPTNGKDGAAGLNGKDGSNGVNGKDGADGLAGKDGLDGASGKDGQDGINGKDGADGLNGKDGSDGLPGKDGAPGLNGKDGADGLAGKDGAAGVDGKDGANGINGKDGADGLNGKDGADGINGKDYDPTVLSAAVVIEVSKQFKELPAAPAGKDANAAEIAAEVFERVMRMVPEPKAGEDGKSVTVEEIKPLLEGEVSRWELEFERRAGDILQRAVDRMPKPKDGLPGFGLDDFTIDAKDDGRVLVFKFENGDRTIQREVRTGFQIYREVFKAGHPYQRGDTFTFGGSQWHTVKDAAGSEKPGDGSGTYRLSVKKGNDGKDGAS